MTPKLQTARSPEEVELQERLDELATLEEKLAAKELDLATLFSELHAFEIRYIQATAEKFAELDGIVAEIAGLSASHTPHDQEAQATADTSRRRAQETKREADEVGEAIGSETFLPTKEIQEFYRSLAKKVHQTSLAMKTIANVETRSWLRSIGRTLKEMSRDYNRFSLTGRIAKSQSKGRILYQGSCG
ncbi:MAG: hypothetical protein ACC700_17065 [Anaerolineales bacterium]